MPAGLVGLPILGTLILVVPLYVVLLWLSSHGQLMFVGAVAHNHSQLGKHWKRSSRRALSLFGFRLVLDLLFWLSIALLVLLFLWVFALVVGNPFNPEDFSDADFEPEMLLKMLLVIAPFGLVLLLFVLTRALIECLLRNLVTALMFHFDLPCTKAWKHLGSVARGNIDMLLFFVLIRIVIAVGIGIVTSAVTVILNIVTCCIGGNIPVLLQTLLAPLFVFERAYSLYVLESLGPDYQIIREEWPSSDPLEATPPPPSTYE